MTKNAILALTALMALGGCTVRAPEHARPVAAPTSLEPLTVNQGFPAQQPATDNVASRGAALAEVVQPSNPLRLSRAEQETLASTLLELRMYGERYDFREAELYGATKAVWKKGQDVPARPGSTLEQTFRESAKEARQALEARAGATRALAAPFPAILEGPRKVPKGPDDDGPWEAVVPEGGHLQMNALPGFLTEAASNLTPEQAARALAELEAIQEVATGQEEAWARFLAIASKGERQTRLAAASVARGSEGYDLVALQEEALPWAYGILR